MLGRAESRAGIEADNLLAGHEAVRAPHLIRRRFVVGRREELHAAIELRASSDSCEPVISIDDGARDPSATGVTLRGWTLCQQASATMQCITNPIVATTEPGGEC